MSLARIKASIYYERGLWVGMFERLDRAGYAIARHIFGKEPLDPEVYAFVLHHFQDLQFGSAKDIQVEITRVNPKRAQREAKKEMERLKQSSKPSTLAQDALREELEKHKKEKRRDTSLERQQRREDQFSLKQEKRKQKRRGR